ncbi:TPA: hypothetical protein EYP13_02020 [Candidatus Micrarchaeota archaeon]|nr:hypothetical protein [Candidatus Micrarchaeota archaeon]
MVLAVMEHKAEFISSLLKKARQKGKADRETLLLLAEARDQVRIVEEALTEMLEELKGEVGEALSFFSFHERKVVEL